MRCQIIIRRGDFVLVCPACYYEGSFYGVGEIWQDAHKCTNFTCKQVSNPCYPSNTSVQIEARAPICQACPSGYKSVSRPYQCCPECSKL